MFFQGYEERVDDVSVAFVFEGSAEACVIVYGDVVYPNQDVSASDMGVFEQYFVHDESAMEGVFQCAGEFLRQELRSQC